MCLAKAYVEKDGKSNFLMSEVASIEVEGKNLTLKNLFGEKKEITATIREIDFVGSSLRLEVSGRGGE
ncbi:MAG: CooT family nickel-binding protein [Dehalococcoidales bacterium]|nr:CooT family nickel-binding protein [Dehalococcoidales bacterium]